MADSYDLIVIGAGPAGYPCATFAYPNDWEICESANRLSQSLKQIAEQHPQQKIALVTHSGSVFSALLRTHRRLEFSLAVSSGQELVTTTSDYLDWALDRQPPAL